MLHGVTQRLYTYQAASVFGRPLLFYIYGTHLDLPLFLLYYIRIQYLNPLLLDHSFVSYSILS